jgi:flagellar basal-body rod modification protein FlgD
MTDLLQATSSTTSTSTATNASSARASLSTNFDTFLRLLTAQLQNQDPLSPMDANQFTEQLVQYSQVEQQIKTNEQLESLLGQNSTDMAGGALAYLGRVATIDSDRVAKGRDGAQWLMSLDGEARAASASILDSSGRTVRTMDLGARGRESSVSWDGRLSDGRQAPDGVYRLVVRATDAAGEPVTPKLRVEETITAVSMAGAEPELVTASGSRPFDAIRSIRVAQ